MITKKSTAPNHATTEKIWNPKSTPKITEVAKTFVSCPFR